MAVSESWFWQAHVVWGCRKAHTKTSAILKSRVGTSMRDSCFLLHFASFPVKIPARLGNEFDRPYVSFLVKVKAHVEPFLHRFVRFLNAEKRNVGEDIECRNCCNPWRKTKRGEEAETMLCLSRNEKSTRRLHCRTRWGKLWRSHRST